MKSNAAPAAALLLLAALLGPLGLTSSAGCRRRAPEADAARPAPLASPGVDAESRPSPASPPPPEVATGPAADDHDPAAPPDPDALPPDLVPDWVAADAPRTYLPDDLHMLVDGGDGVYLRYGFVRALRRTYRPARPANRRIRVELFAFSTPAGALGRYDHESLEGNETPWSAAPPPAELAGRVDAARLDGDQLRLARGRFLAVLRYEDDAETDVARLIADAKEPLLVFAVALGEALGGETETTDEHR